MSTSKRPQRPNLDGAELGFFDVLVALHVRYIRQRGEAFRLAAQQGISDERIIEIAKMSLLYSCPEDLKANMIKVVRIADAMIMPGPYHFPANPKPS